MNEEHVSEPGMKGVSGPKGDPGWLSPRREQPCLVAALAKAQSVITAPARNRVVTVRTRTGGSYTFRYATLDHIIEGIRKPLTDNGLWFTQIIERDEDGKYRLVTRLLHESGEAIESHTPLLVEDKGNQAFGSSLTYMRRYALTALLGIAADEDDDGNSGDGHTVEAMRKRPQPEAAPPAESTNGKPQKPHGIPVAAKEGGADGERDWIAWGTTFAAALKAAAPDEVEEWLKRNADQLNNCKQQAPAIHRRLMKIASPKPREELGEVGPKGQRKEVA